MVAGSLGELKELEKRFFFEIVEDRSAETVNHSEEFVNSETGAHTQTIESTWHALKSHLPKSGSQKQLYEGYFWEYVIRKKYLNSSTDKFIEFLSLIKRVYTQKSSYNK